MAERADQNPLLISFKAYLERVMADQDRLRQTELRGLRTEILARLDASDRAVVLQLDAAEKALTLKSAEIERRLEMLNGEASRLAHVLDKSVPREVWEQNDRAWLEWKTGVDKRLHTAAGGTKMAVYVVGLVIIAVEVVLRVWG